ncbi:uncharacterized protein K02A2.6-like [Bacillus rossius redtenbacheri]|uniref:uncharacterized protein K02A2.6-like n=1 Tax=Bacillus rossius redtenbacheri TaxID=93214 RepID=UPI002FDDD86D
MEGLKPPGPFTFDGDLANNWKRWKQKFLIYMKATGGDGKDDGIKIATLLHVLGEEGQDLFFTMDISEENSKKYDSVLACLESYFLPKTNQSVERHKFNNRVQEEGETIDAFVTALRRLSTNCGYDGLRDDLIKDRIVCGVRDSRLKDRLLREPILTLAKATQICKAAEQTQELMETIDRKEVVHTVYRSNQKSMKSSERSTEDEDICEKRTSNYRTRGKPMGRAAYPSHSNNSFKGPRDGRATHQQYNKPSTSKLHPEHGTHNEGFSRYGQSFDKMCHKCGHKHSYQQCPAINAACYNCNKRGHYSRMCRLKSVNEVLNKESNVGSEKPVELLLGCVTSKMLMPVDGIATNLTDEWFYSLYITDSDVNINFKVDTGAQVNVLPESVFLKLKLTNTALLKSQVALRTYSGSEIQLLGKCFLDCRTNLGTSHKLEFQVTKVDHSTPIIGLPGIQQLGILKRVDTVDARQEPQMHKMLSQYKAVFEGLGNIRVEPHQFVLKPDSAPPTVSFQRIPFSLHDQLQEELDRMIKLGVIIKVDEPTEWLNPIVVVKKPSGELRVCLDPQPLNNAILREHCRLPTLEEVTLKMQGSQYFSTLDANKGFWQIQLTEESSKLTTFHSPSQGRLRFTRLPYGLSCASEIFFKVFSTLFQDIDGVQVYIDDIIVFGKDQHEHDQRLERVLQRALKKNVTFNWDKCRFRLSEVKYIGHIFGKEGIKVDPSKVQAITDFLEPKGVSDLQRFLGMITYLGKFVPNLSEHTALLRELCKQGAIWQWSERHQNAFEKVKILLATTPVLQFYNPHEPITISVDASQKGLGAVLLQSKGPVAYASKSLTQTQQNYAQIEKELLAVVYGCERFHQYIFGRTVLVETDHKPLEAIFKKPLDRCPLRLQRMRIKLQNYDITLKYVPGKELAIADALSRASGPDTNFELHEQEIAAQQGLVVHHIQASNKTLGNLQSETLKDETLIQLKAVILKGWPNTSKKLPSCVKEYYSFKEDLTIQDDLIYKGTQIVIPTSMRGALLDKIHYTHLGIQKCKLRARECVFWPGMSRDIENRVGNCTTCRAAQHANTKEPQIDKEIPGRPWQIVAIDIFHFQGKDYLLLVDTYSKYPEFSHLPNLSSTQVIAHCKAVMARHGIPEILYSDNGPQFSSREFKDFSMRWDFKHKTSSPMYPQSNGLAERHIQTIKHMLKKSVADRKDIMLALLEYRNTPIDTTMPSPAQLLFSRRLRGLLPSTADRFIPQIQPNIVQDLYARQQKQKHYYDYHSRVLKPLKEGSLVKVRNRNSWQSGQIVKLLDRPRSYRVRVDTGHEVERNRKDIIRDSINQPLVIAGDIEEPSGDTQTVDKYESKTPPVHEQLSCELVKDGDDNSQEGFRGFEERHRLGNNVHDTQRNFVQNGERVVKSSSGRTVKLPNYLKDYVCKI